MFSYENERCARMYSMENFSDWLGNELLKRGWTQSELARRANIHRGTISNIVSGERKAGLDTCLSIAQALQLPADIVLEKAGHLAKKEKTTSETEEMAYLFEQLSPQDREEILELLRFKAQRQKKSSREKPPARNALMDK